MNHALGICIALCAFVVLSVCLLYVSVGLRVSTTILGPMLMESVILFVCNANCGMYWAGSGVKRVHVVLSE